MKRTPREQAILLLLPMMIVLMGYGWWYRFAEWPKQTNAQRAHQDALARAVTPAALGQARLAVTTLTEEGKQLARQREQLEAASRQVVQPALAAQRIAAEEALTDLFQRHDLRLIEVGKRDSASDARPPAALRQAYTRLGQKPNEEAGEARRYQLAGRFLDVLGMVRDLAGQDRPPGIPIGLAMAEAQPEQPGARRVWILTLWM